MLKAVIFDKDGVLVDTEGVILQCIEIIINKYSEIPYNDNDGKGLRGSSARETFSLLIEKYKLPFSLDQMLEKYHAEYTKILDSLDNIIFEGVIELLGDLRNNNILFGIGTNSSRERTKLSLKGLEEYFDVIVTAEDVSASKPSPEMFLKVSEKLGIEPNECVVIGDTNNDALAARSAGMKFVFREHGLGISLSTTPDMIIKSMKEVNSSNLKKLFEV